MLHTEHLVKNYIEYEPPTPDSGASTRKVRTIPICGLTKLKTRNYLACTYPSYFRSTKGSRRGCCTQG